MPWKEVSLPDTSLPDHRLPGARFALSRLTLVIPSAKREGISPSSPLTS